jgi:hypothetical protein
MGNYIHQLKINSGAGDVAQVVEHLPKNKF